MIAKHFQEICATAQIKAKQQDQWQKNNANWSKNR